MKHAVSVGSIAVMVSTLGCGGAAVTTPADKVVGAGSTFVKPLMIRWANEYEKTTDQLVAYEAVGSAGGLHWLQEQKADFGCTDGPMTDAELAKARKVNAEVVHVPLVMGAVVAAYNLPDVKEPVRISGPVLAGIYLGDIATWDDPALKRLNPDVRLPHQALHAVHRSDGSGTTYIWSDYLSKVSPKWKEKIGIGHSIEFPGGEDGLGNEGVAERVKQTAGSVGYVELAFAHQADLPFCLVQNRQQRFVKANLESVTAAAAGAQIPDDLRYSITDAPGENSYPICGTTWAVAFLRQSSPKREKLADFLSWMIHQGQEFAPEMFYAPLPKQLVGRAQAKIGRIRAGN